MHVDIRFGNKEHFGELQKKVYSRVVTPQNQFCFFPILYKLLIIWMLNVTITPFDSLASHTEGG